MPAHWMSIGAGAGQRPRPRLYLSGMSAKARGVGESILAGHKAEFAMPNEPVDLAAHADKVLCY